MAQLVLFNKPYNVLSQFTDSDENHASSRETLSDYLSIDKVYPAGRLDRDSEGLLLLTDSGPLQHQIAHPKHSKEKSYWVQVDGEITEQALIQLRQGVLLKDGLTLPAKARKIKAPDIWPRNPPVRFRKEIPTSWIELSISEGKNRQVRRMTAAVGFPTLRLIRHRIGKWSLNNLQPGDYKIARHTTIKSVIIPLLIKRSVMPIQSSTSLVQYLIISLWLPVLLFFCHTLKADTFVRDDIITQPDIDNFSMCHAHGCKEVEQLSLTNDEWQTIRRHFHPEASSAEAERLQIANAIAEFEQLIGAKTGTSGDKAGLFPALGSNGQLDCIDESTNTTTYLLILEKQGLLKWHEPMDHVTRGFFIFGWPHSSGAMREKASSENDEVSEFAVDSWFEDNGKRPHIIPLSQWRSGWNPPDSKD
jgi:23S rRNA pseudouridine2457 synthase